MTYYRTHLRIRTCWSIRMHVGQQMAAEDKLQRVTWGQTLQVLFHRFSESLTLVSCFHICFLCLLLTFFIKKTLFKRYLSKLQLHCATGPNYSKKDLKGQVKKNIVVVFPHNQVLYSIHRVSVWFFYTLTLTLVNYSKC